MPIVEDFFVKNNVKFHTYTDFLEIYSFDSSVLEELQHMSLHSQEDVEKFSSLLQKLFSTLKNIEYYALVDVPIYSLHEYSFTPKNRLIKRKKEQFEHISSLKDVFEALKSHYDSFEVKKSFKKKNFMISIEEFRLEKQFKQVESIILEQIEELTHESEELKDELHLKNKELQSYKVKLQETDKKLQDFTYSFSNNEQKRITTETKITSLEFKISKSVLQREQLEHSIKELELELISLKDSAQSTSLFIPVWQAVISLGTLCYTSYNSYEYQHYKLKKKIISKRRKIEELHSHELTLNFKLQSLQKDLKKFNELTNEQRKATLEEEIKELTSSIKVLEKDIIKKSKLKVEFDEKIKDFKEFLPKQLKSVLLKIIAAIEEQYNFIEQYLDVLNFKETKIHHLAIDETLNEGYYKKPQA